MGENPTPKWRTRELLALAYVVATFGKSNGWRAMKRKVKFICEEQGRPKHWYSKENCKRQYKELLKAEKIMQEKESKSGAKVSPTADDVFKRIDDQYYEEKLELCRQIDLDIQKEAEEVDFDLDSDLSIDDFIFQNFDCL